MYSVLQVTPELNAGGVERTTIEMAEAVTRAGGLAVVASAGGRLESDLEAAGGELIRLPLQSKNPITIYANAGRLARVAQDRNINLIHARSRAPAWSALLAARRLKLPFVTTYHGIYNAKTPLKRWYNSVMARGDLVIANSEYTRAHVLQTYQLPPSRVIAIPRGVDIDVFDPARIDPGQVAAMRAAWGLQPNDPRFVLLMPARLTRWKGQLVLIEALARLARRRPGAVMLVFAGDAQGRDDYAREMENAISSAGLKSDVVIAGHVGQMATAFAAADAAAFPSTDPEAFGRGAVEAQAMRRPVIAADHGGLSETVVEGVTGLKVAPGNPAALEAALERLMDMGSQARAAMGAQGRDRVCLLYTKTALQASTLNVYDQLQEGADDEAQIGVLGKPAPIAKPVPKAAERVLVIKLSGLAEFVQALAPAKAIREHHVGARITLLTTEPLRDLAEKSPYFDVVEADGKPKEPQDTAQLIRRIRAAKYDVIYDLEGSNRTTGYFHGLKPWPPLWSGIAPGASHVYNDPDRERLHPLDRFERQLDIAGVELREPLMPDLRWIRTSFRDPPRLQPDYFGVRGRYVILLPRSSDAQPNRRWPQASYVELAKRIAANGVTPVVMGTAEERDVGAAIALAEPRAKNLVARTDQFQSACLAERAAFVVGDDVDLMHVAAAAGASCIALLSSLNDPSRATPRGHGGAVALTAAVLADLPVDQVDRQLRNCGAYRAVATA